MMLRTALLSLILLVSLTSSSLLRKTLVRRQADQTSCHGIEGFDCKCTPFRITCTTGGPLPSQVTVVESEKHKHQSVDLVIQTESNLDINDRIFESIKELYKHDGADYEFRIKFEKFTGLQLSSPGILNRVFPDNLPSNARKHLALDMYNRDVRPTNNAHLFQNLHADSLELYAVHAFDGTFEQLFDGANIKFLRLSGGEIRSDYSKSFTGNVARFEYAKQATALSAQNFPAYPVHELVINAFYVSEFNNEYPPNYSNLAELRVTSQGRIPANAFSKFPNLKVLQLTSPNDIDPHALDGLNQLEKLTIKDTTVSSDLLKNAPNVKEYETNVDKLDENAQCQLIEKLANGQLAVQAIPNGAECTCVNAYLNTASGRYPCEPKHCEHSPCAAIKNNFNPATGTFSPPPAIRRADGTDALRPRDTQVYNGPYHVTQQDQDTVLRAAPPPPPPQQQQEYDPNRPAEEQQQGQYPSGGEPGHEGHHEGGSRQGGERRPEGEGNNQSETPSGESQPGGEGGSQNTQEGEGGTAATGTDSATPPKKGMSWVPIIIIAAAIVGILIIGAIVLLLRKKSNANKGGYSAAAPNEQAAARA